MFNSLLNLSEFSSRIRGLLWGQFYMNFSHFMSVPLLAIYLAKEIQLSPIEIGTVMAANLVCAQALPIVAGPFADKYGMKLCMAIGLYLRGMGLAGIAVNDEFALLVVSACLGGAGVAIYEVSLFGIFGQESSDQRAGVFTANNQMLNLGVILGPLAGTLASQISITTSLAIGAATFFILSCRVYYLEDTPIARSQSKNLFDGLGNALQNSDFRRLVIVCLPWYFLFPQLYVTFPLYLSRLGDADSSAIIYIVNGVVGVIFMILARKWLTRTSPLSLLTIAYISAASLFASMVFTNSLLWFLLFVAGYTIVETIILPALEVATSAFSDRSSQGTYFGVLSAAGAIAGSLGYYAGSWLSIRGDKYEIWLTFGAVGILGVILTLDFINHITQDGKSRIRELGQIPMQ